MNKVARPQRNRLGVRPWLTSMGASALLTVMLGTAAAAESDGAEQRIKHLESMISNLQDRVRDLEAGRDRLRRRIASEERYSRGLEERLVSVEEETSALREKAMSRLAEIESALSERAVGAALASSREAGETFASSSADQGRNQNEDSSQPAGSGGGQDDSGGSDSNGSGGAADESGRSHTGASSQSNARSDRDADNEDSSVLAYGPNQRDAGSSGQDGNAGGRGQGGTDTPATSGSRSDGGDDGGSGAGQSPRGFTEVDRSDRVNLVSGENTVERKTAETPGTSRGGRPRPSLNGHPQGGGQLSQRSSGGPSGSNQASSGARSRNSRPVAYSGESSSDRRSRRDAEVKDAPSHAVVFTFDDENRRRQVARFLEAYNIAIQAKRPAGEQVALVLGRHPSEDAAKQQKLTVSDETGLVPDVRRLAALGS